MKFIAVILIVASASADFIPFNPRYTSENQEQDGPYQPSGWRPSGPALILPARQQLPINYGPPPPLSQEYGPPTTTESPETTTTELPTTTESDTESEQVNNLSQQNEAEKSGKLSAENPATMQQGIYYIYHPSGLLQRIIYTTEDDVRNMAYTARLKYQNVEPIREPIYTYDPKTLAFYQLQL